jgi:hypothetical protein
VKARANPIPTPNAQLKEHRLQILMTDEARDHIRDLGRPIALDYLAAIG